MARRVFLRRSCHGFTLAELLVVIFMLGVCNFVFCDGHVAGLAFTIDRDVVQALLTPNGHETVPEY